jgi:competence protein ComEC
VAHIATMPTWGLILIALGGAWLCLWQRRWRLWGIPAIACGLLSIALVRSPDVLVDGQGKLLAVRSDSGDLMFSSKRRSRFEQEIWMRMSGTDGPGDSWPDPGLSSDGRLSCDSLGCLYRVNQRTVALIYGDGALIEDCWSADVVISTEPIRSRCPATRVIDRFSLWRQGGHALWLGEDGILVESVNGRRGRRPWSTRPSARATPPAKPES